MQTATATVLPFRPPSGEQVMPAVHTSEPDLADRLMSALFRPRALDRLDVAPATVLRAGGLYRPVVIVSIDDRPLIFSADAARRIAVTLDAAHRTGAALDLMQGADDAEALSHSIKGRLH